MRSSAGFGAEDMGARGGWGLRGGMGGKTGVRPVDTGDGGVGGRGSTRAAEAWWARSWSSCSSLEAGRKRSSRGWVAVGVCSSGVEDSESSSRLDRNPNQVGFEGFLREMVANYYGDSRDKAKLDLLLRLVRVGSIAASEKVQSFKVPTIVGFEGVRVSTIVESRFLRGSIHSEVGR